MDVPDLTGVSPAVQLHIIQAYLAFKIIGQLYSSTRTGGGLKRILTSFWFGENIPKPVAQDYKSEMNTIVPIPQKDQPPSP